MIVESRQSVIVQPPSLCFPSWITADPERVSDMKPVSYLLHDDGNTNTLNKLQSIDGPIRKRVKGLRLLRYLLFNSSVEARKNLLFLTQAYSESDLSSQGIQLCVTGKLKDDDVQ